MHQIFGEDSSVQATNRRVVNINRLNLNTGKLLLNAEHFRSLFTSESFDINYFLIMKKYSISLILPRFKILFSTVS